MLARAEDKHIWLQVGDETIPSFVRPSVPNANYKLLADLVPNFKKHGSAVASGRWDDGIGYVAIAAWDRGKLEEGKSAFDALDGLQDTHALIIDVRLNSGGDEPLAQTFAGCFVGERKLYGKDVYRDAKSPSGYTAPKERWLEPNASRPRYNGRVVVLSGPAVMSSCESFLLMMKCSARRSDRRRHVARQFGQSQTVRSGKWGDSRVAIVERYDTRWQGIRRCGYFSRC